MDIREQFKDAFGDLKPGESLAVLGAMIDVLLEETRKLNDGFRQVYNIPIDKIDLFTDHPFSTENDEEMIDLVESIRKHGLLTPGAVRIKNNGRYELLSGYRRFRACKLAGFETFRCEVHKLSDKEAVMFMIEANRQRMKMGPRAKSRVYSMKRKITDDYDSLSEFRMEISDDSSKIGKYVYCEAQRPVLRSKTA